MSKPSWAGSYDPVEFAEKTNYFCPCPECEEQEDLFVDQLGTDDFAVVCPRCGYLSPSAETSRAARRIHNEEQWERED